MESGGQIAFFLVGLVGLSQDGLPVGRRALVPLGALRVLPQEGAGSPALGLDWTEEQLLRHEVFVEGGHLPDSPVNSGTPATGRWTLATVRSTSRRTEPRRST